jgi:hypothetical protein
MDVVSMEVISLEEVANLRRHARHERREESERHDNMTMRDVTNLFDLDWSNFRARAALAPAAAPLLFDSQGLNKYEATWAIAGLLFAKRSEGKALLVEFSDKPSKAFEDRFRQAANASKLTVHFYRLTGSWVAITLQSKEIPD